MFICASCVVRVVVSAGNENGVDAANSKAKENSRVMFVAPGFQKLDEILDLNVGCWCNIVSRCFRPRRTGNTPQIVKMQLTAD